MADGSDPAGDLFEGAGAPEQPVPMLDLTDAPGLVDAPGRRRTSRRRTGRNPWIAVALVAALGTGVAGYALGHHDGGSNAASGTADPLPEVTSLLDTSATESGSPTSGFDLYLGDLAEEQLRAAQQLQVDADSGAVFTPEGSTAVPNHFRAGEALADEPSRAAGWVLDQAAVVTKVNAEGLGQIFGATGEARAEGDAWVVGPAAGSGPIVRLIADGTARFDYVNSADAQSCQAGPAKTGGLCEIPVEDPVGRDEAAARIALEAIARIGIDTSELRVAQTNFDGPETRQLVLDLLINGRSTGLQWQATVVGDGVVAMSGPLADLVPLRDFGVISPREAVKRLNDPRFSPSANGNGGGEYSIFVEVPAGTAALQVPDLPDLTGPISVLSAEHTILAATPNLVQYRLGQGPVLLLPGYALADGSDGSWPVVGVADKELRFGEWNP